MAGVVWGSMKYAQHSGDTDFGVATSLSYIPTERREPLHLEYPLLASIVTVSRVSNSTQA